MDVNIELRHKIGDLVYCKFSSILQNDKSIKQSAVSFDSIEEYVLCKVTRYNYTLDKVDKSKPVFLGTSLGSSISYSVEYTYLGVSHLFKIDEDLVFPQDKLDYIKSNYTFNQTNYKDLVRTCYTDNNLVYLQLTLPNSNLPEKEFSGTLTLATKANKDYVISYIVLGSNKNGDLQYFIE